MRLELAKVLLNEATFVINTSSRDRGQLNHPTSRHITTDRGSLITAFPRILCVLLERVYLGAYGDDLGIEKNGEKRSPALSNSNSEYEEKA